VRILTLRVLLALYFVASLAVAVPVALGIGRAGELAGTTSGKILAAAIVALGVGALLAAADPRRHRAVIVILIVFKVLSSLAILSRLLADEHTNDRRPSSCRSWPHTRCCSRSSTRTGLSKIGAPTQGLNGSSPEDSRPATVHRAGRVAPLDLNPRSSTRCRCSSRRAGSPTCMEAYSTCKGM
jgi:hypothetical protein